MFPFLFRMHTIPDQSLCSQTSKLFIGCHIKHSYFSNFVCYLDNYSPGNTRTAYLSGLWLMGCHQVILLKQSNKDIDGDHYSVC